MSPAKCAFSPHSTPRDFNLNYRACSTRYYRPLWNSKITSNMRRADNERCSSHVPSSAPFDILCETRMRTQSSRPEARRCHGQSSARACTAITGHFALQLATVVRHFDVAFSRFTSSALRRRISSPSIDSFSCVLVFVERWSACCCHAPDGPFWNSWTGHVRPVLMLYHRGVGWCATNTLHSRREYSI